MRCREGRVNVLKLRGGGIVLRFEKNIYPCHNDSPLPFTPQIGSFVYISTTYTNNQSWKLEPQVEGLNVVGWDEDFQVSKQLTHRQPRKSIIRDLL
jgi:hypothetical protein